MSQRFSTMVPPVPVRAEWQIEWKTERWGQHCYNHRQKLTGFPSMFGGRTLTKGCTGCNSVKTRDTHYHCIFSFLFIGWEPTMWPANNCLQIRVSLQIIFCSYVTETMLYCENGRLVPQAVREWFDILSLSKEQWSSDKTIITEHSHCKISWFVSVSQINSYLP